MDYFSYIGFINFTINPNPPKSKQKKSQEYLEPEIEETVDLKQIFDSIEFESINEPNNKIIKKLQLQFVEACSSVLKCTGPDFIASKDAQTETRTNQYEDPANYMYLNIAGRCQIEGAVENISIRIARTGSIGFKVAMSSQNVIMPKDENADAGIDRLGYELQKFIIKLFPIIKIKRKYELATMTIHGFNLENPTTGERPPVRIKNLVEISNLLVADITHKVSYNEKKVNKQAIIAGRTKKEIVTRIDPRKKIKVPDPNAPPVKRIIDRKERVQLMKNQKDPTRVNFKRPRGQLKTFPTFSLSQWLMVDFLGVSNIKDIRDLQVKLEQNYIKNKSKIIYDTANEGQVPKSKRKQNVVPKIEIELDVKPDEQVDIPYYNENTDKFYTNGKVWNCDRKTKIELDKICNKMKIDNKGKKNIVCQRIESKAKQSTTRIALKVK